MSYCIKYIYRSKNNLNPTGPGKTRKYYCSEIVLGNEQNTFKFVYLFVQIQEYAFHTMLTLTGNTFPLLFTYLGGIINQSQELIDLISNYTGINISSINVYSDY